MATSKNSKEFMAGYKFKETHEEIHFIKSGHGSAGDEYQTNFTTDDSKAEVFLSEEEAESNILELMKDFERDDDYRWTPVVLNVGVGSTRMIISSRWH